MKGLPPLLFVALLGSLPCVAAAHGEANATHGTKATAAPAEQTAWGIAGKAGGKLRTVEIRMLDAMRFTPEHLQVRRGETVRLVLRNEGALMHELVIGTSATLQEHAALMERFPNMEHAEPWMAHVPPGKRGELLWTFNRSGDFEFACLIAGHFQAGMRGRITVR